LENSILWVAKNTAIKRKVEAEMFKVQQSIVLFGNPVLRKRAEAVTEYGPELDQLLDVMADILYAAEGRAGLAAPQIKVSKRVVVVDCGEGKLELINPEILERRGEQTGPEACLSFPGYTGIVKRANLVKVKSTTRDQREILVTAEGFTARCLQHEIDHLDGILYIDHLHDGQLFDDRTGEQVSRARLKKLIGEV
jgi:peptide deformylase